MCDATSTRAFPLRASRVLTVVACRRQAVILTPAMPATPATLLLQSLYSSSRLRYVPAVFRNGVMRLNARCFAPGRQGGPTAGTPDRHNAAADEPHRERAAGGVCSAACSLRIAPHFSRLHEYLLGRMARKFRTPSMSTMKKSLSRCMPLFPTKCVA